MIEDLIHYEFSEIERAFKIWRQESENIPTPAGIIKLIHIGKPKRIVPDDSKDFSLSNEERARIEAMFIKAKDDLQKGIIYETPNGSVPWYGKNWEFYTEKDKFGLEKHCDELFVKKGHNGVHDYIMFLKTFHKIPEGRFLNKYKQG